MNRTARIVNALILILGLLMIAYYLILGLAVRFGQSLQFLWLLGGLICIGRYAYWRRADRRKKFPPRALCIALRALAGLLLAVFLAVECIILVAGLGPAPAGLDYIVVLGARVNPGGVPSGSLRNRIQRGIDYLQDNPNARAVLSGGQGADEDISEAQCMYEQMTAAGVDPARLILEDQSTDTSENLRFSRAHIPEGASVGLVTNNFHIFRSLALARGLGWDGVEGVPVATSLLSFPHYMMREFIGVAYDCLRGNLAF